MYTTLTLEDCLYVVQQQDIDYFTDMIEMHKSLAIFDEEKYEFWQITFNIYITLNNTNNEYVLNPEKLLLYSSNFYSYQSILEIESFQKFLKFPPQSPYALFILSYYIALNLYNLLKQYLEQDICVAVAIESLKNSLYYRQHLCPLVQNDISHQFYRTQKVLVKIITQVKTNGLFEQCIQESVLETRQYLRAHAL